MVTIFKIRKNRMKSIKWIVPLVVGGVLVASGCSQQAKKPTSSANRLTTGNAVGSGLSRANTLGGGTTSRLGGRTTSSFGGTGASTYGAKSKVGGSLTSDFSQGSLGNRGDADSRLSDLDSRAGGSGDYKVTDLNDPSSVLSRQVIYFAYDQSTIEPEYFEILDAHSELLASNPNLTIRLEGHADERGSREYNVALSERRAQAVKQFMDLKGVGSEQSQTVAYGEELPVDSGHNEAAWSKNRRVEIKYIGR